MSDLSASLTSAVSLSAFGTGGNLHSTACGEVLLKFMKRIVLS
jgi:hypothetical protein